MGDPAEQTVYSADTFGRRCEGLDSSVGRIYYPPRPSLLSLQRARAGVINVSKLNMHRPERK